MTNIISLPIGKRINVYPHELADKITQQEFLAALDEITDTYKKYNKKSIFSFFLKAAVLVFCFVVFGVGIQKAGPGMSKGATAAYIVASVAFIVTVLVGHHVYSRTQYQQLEPQLMRVVESQNRKKETLTWRCRKTEDKEVGSNYINTCYYVDIEILELSELPSAHTRPDEDFIYGDLHDSTGQEEQPLLISDK